MTLHRQKELTEYLYRAKQTKNGTNSAKNIISKYLRSKTTFVNAKILILYYKISIFKDGFRAKILRDDFALR